MKQSECMTLTDPAPRPWLARLADWMNRATPRDGLVRPDLLSRHTLRDIGLGEDLRGNHLLNDAWLRR